MHKLTDTCPKCRWIFGDFTPTAYACTSHRSEHWECAACGLIATDLDDAKRHCIDGSWGGPLYPEPFLILDKLIHIVARGWYVPPRVLAVAVWRAEKDTQEAEHMMHHLRLRPYYPGSGLADLSLDDFMEHLRLAGGTGAA